MGTIYKDYTDKPLADLNLDYHKTKKADTQTEWTLHQTCIYTHKNKICTAINLNNNIQGVDVGATTYNPPDPH
jgi:hypothetical protein